MTKSIMIADDGDYLFTLSFNYNGNAATSDVMVRATFDGNALDLNDRSNNVILKQEPKDTAGNATVAYTGTGSAQKLNYNSQFLLKNILAGTYDFVLDVGSEATNTESSIWNITGVITPCTTI